MKTTFRIAIIAAACSAAWIGDAGAQITTAAGATATSSNTVYLKRTQDRFGGFAGSSANAESLTTGLRDGTKITLIDGPEKVSFTPPTKPMGNGNVTRTLGLAQRDLAAAGITDPSPTEIKIAMMGGTIKNPDGSTTTFQGVLQLRSEGMGWGQIAHTIGVHPGMGKSAPVAAPVPAPVSSTAGAKSGIVTAGGTGQVSNGNGRALGHSSSSASGGTVTTAAGVSAGASGASSGKGQGNAFGRSK